MSDSPTATDAPPTKYTLGTMVMMAVGFILLLPGACALIFLPAVLTDGYVRAALQLLLLCLLISGGGIWLIVAARRAAIAAAHQEAQERDHRP